MRVCIHRGAKQIGGTCVEIETQGKRLVVDIGQPLESQDGAMVEMPAVAGFKQADPSLLGVVLTHPHLDHYGLAFRVPKTIPFVLGAATKRILEAAAVFTPSGGTFENTITIESGRRIELGPFMITPYLMDHSAYDSYALLIEGNGKKLFYTGDFRGHGRKAMLLERLVANPPKDVNVLLMEGTTITRAGTNEGFQTEWDLEKQLVNIFENTTHMPLVWCSGQNIDRLVSVFRACKRSGRTFIVDMYTAHILKATGNPNIPQAHWGGVKIFLPEFQKRRIKWQGGFDILALYKPYRIYPEQLRDAASSSVMLFRPSMQIDLEGLDCLGEGCLVYSMWDGYLAKDTNKPFLEWLNRCHIPIYKCHTSGHASLIDLKRLRAAFQNAVVVPIHTQQPNRYDANFGNSRVNEDGEWWTIDKNNTMGKGLTMNGGFGQRGLSQRFMSDLQKGVLAPLIERVKSDTSMDMEIRQEYLNIYYRGGNILRISRDGKGKGYSAFFDKKYASKIELRLPSRNISDVSEARAWLNMIPVLKDSMDLWFGSHRKDERAAQQMIVYENNVSHWAGGTDYFIIDIEYANHGGARFDLIALRWDSIGAVRKLQGQYLPKIAAIEMKTGDAALNGKAGLLEHYQQLEAFFGKPHKVNEFKQEMLGVFKQKRELGLIPALRRNSNEVVKVCDDVDVIFLLANHDPASRKLIGAVTKIVELQKAHPPVFNLYFATATFMGFGLYAENVLSLDEFRSHLDRMANNR